MPSISLLFETDEILLVNKAAGVSVQGGVGISHPLDDELSRQMGYRVHLVHRLDKDTSGILLVAKSAAAAARWSRLLGTEQVRKEYDAVCFGVPEVQGRAVQKGCLRGTVQAHGREQLAETHFIVKKTVSLAVEDASIPLSLVHLSLGTGRMHQIRIQMAQAKAPVVADDRHGDFRRNKLLRKVGIKRLQLAATRLTLPIDGAARTFSVPLPAHIQQLVEMAALQ